MKAASFALSNTLPFCVCWFVQLLLYCLYCFGMLCFAVFLTSPRNWRTVFKQRSEFLQISTAFTLEKHETIAKHRRAVIISKSQSSLVCHFRSCQVTASFSARPELCPDTRTWLHASQSFRAKGGPLRTGESQSVREATGAAELLARPTSWVCEFRLPSVCNCC